MLSEDDFFFFFPLLGNRMKNRLLGGNFQRDSYKML